MDRKISQSKFENTHSYRFEELFGISYSFATLVKTQCYLSDYSFYKR